MSEKNVQSKSEKATKTEAEVLEAVEAHVEPDATEVPDHTAQRMVEAHRQAQVKRQLDDTTGDDSAVNPQPDRDAPGVPTSFAPITDGERQATEQPDRYAVGDEAAEYAVEPNAKNRRGGPRKKADDKAEDKVEEPTWPAQFEGVKHEDVTPAQYSW